MRPLSTTFCQQESRAHTISFLPPHSSGVDHALGTHRNPPRLGRHLPAADRPQHSAARRLPPLAGLEHPAEPRADQGDRERGRRGNDIPRRRAQPLEPEARVRRGRCGRGGTARGRGRDGDDGVVGKPNSAVFEQDGAEGPTGWGRERVRSTGAEGDRHRADFS